MQQESVNGWWLNSRVVCVQKGPGSNRSRDAVNRGTMGVNSLPKTVTRQRRGCDLNPGPSAPGSTTLTARLPSHRLCGYMTDTWCAGVVSTAWLAGSRLLIDDELRVLAVT